MIDSTTPEPPPCYQRGRAGGGKQERNSPSSSRRELVGGFSIATILLTALAAGAHPLSPTLIELRQRPDSSVFDVRWKTSVLRVPGSDVQPQLPEHCTAASGIIAREDAGSLHREWSIDCGDKGVVKSDVGFSGLGPAQIDGLVRIQLANGRLVRGVVTNASPTINIEEATGPLKVFLDYIRLGFHHILSGLDHLLFVFGLLLLVSNTRSLIKTVTAFTVGHSVTLSLAALGIVRYPTRPIEFIIALSVFLLAVEVTRQGDSKPSAMRRWPWAVALGFGLLHGLGFAGALAEVGLPQHEIPLALLAFNLGIEAGQLAFVVIVLASRKLLAPLLAVIPRWAELIPLYTMGSLAAFWCFERLAAVIAG